MPIKQRSLMHSLNMCDSSPSNPAHHATVQEPVGWNDMASMHQYLFRGRSSQLLQTNPPIVGISQWYCKPPNNVEKTTGTDLSARQINGIQHPFGAVQSQQVGGSRCSLQYVYGMLLVNIYDRQNQRGLKQRYVNVKTKESWIRFMANKTIANHCIYRFDYMYIYIYNVYIHIYIYIWL